MTQDYIATLLQELPQQVAHHRTDDPLHETWRAQARQLVEERFGPGASGEQAFGPLGTVVFPYHRMGAIDSRNLFDIEELIIFSFYWANRGQYQRVADIGANIGLHSLVLRRLGYQVRAYEPDPQHRAVLAENLARNGYTDVDIRAEAVAGEAGEREFIRVLGNTTGSHLAGAKVNPYGELERFTVQCITLPDVMAWADLIKLDIEGEEAKALLVTAHELWETADMLAEIGTPENAQMVYDHMVRHGVNLFSQKIGWEQVKRLEDMPTSYKEGTLFISTKAAMPWRVTVGEQV